MIRKMIWVFFPMLIWTQSFASETEQETAMCKYGAEYMIEVAKQSLLGKSSRPERIEKRRRLIEEWVSRMEKGENPCNIYADIQKAATTF